MEAQMVDGLRASIKECSDRGLSVASKWSSELLLSMPFFKRHPPPPSPVHSPTSVNNQSLVPTQVSDAAPTPARHPHAPVPWVQPEDERALDLEFETQEEDLLFSARAFIESREPMRAIHALRQCRSSKAHFLSMYSQFIATENRALRTWHKLDNNRHQPSEPVNPTVEHLLSRVVNATDPWMLFLKALFLSRLSGRRDEAIEIAILSIAGFQWNWATWALLGSCIEDGEELSAILPLLPLPATHPLVQLFQIKTMNELHIPSENELNLCEQLLGPDFFPGSLWLMSLRACALYHSHDFKSAQAQFERILAIDPNRVEDIDIYSNILYVTDSRLKLSRLANDFLALDRDRPEVCCLVGNLYSLRSEHEKSVKYFRRATQLDRTYLSAWTLMGHEYVEMKNSHAAIESYRRAIDVNRKDYRAWYGVGQAYELLNMHQYALHYYHYATALRPYDVRLWQAQGMCYEEMGKPRDAIECYKRALITADPHEITINLRLANLYGLLQDHGESVAYHRRVVEVCQANGRPIQDFAKSCIKVAEHYLRTNGDLQVAREYLTTVAGSNVEEVVRAAELLKEAELLKAVEVEEEERRRRTAVAIS
ncbi:hypothetical protein DFH07DRAFT_902372 [Mycena maculata]|uniref:Cdc23 domain-containing protein n=1 Tax=Mycena maculata TaxID=230809 RepID=A0AAD7JRT6_9AGAR|nr:hypothetical protein DFH07DRAFT_902372 [Mycena maculata]